MKPTSLPPRLALVAACTALIALAPSCSTGFGSVPGQRRLVVELQDQEKVTGTRLSPLALSIGKPTPFRVIVKAVTTEGEIDTSFSGFVRLSSKPGAIEPLAGPDTEGRNVRLVQGESRAVDVQLVNAYGTTFILADDLGYEPADPLGDPPPRCANGIDDDGDGRVDYPADDGCAFANDDTEDGASFAQGASPPIFFALPRVADIRGMQCDPACSGTGATPYPKEQLLVDTGFHDKPDGTQAFDFDLVVSRISSGGFYVSDVRDDRGGFNNIFAFNFNAPPRMRVCDRMKTFGGTATEFFGFTQISYPTWTLEEWDPRQRTCLVSEPKLLGPSDVNDPGSLLSLSGGLVRAQTTPDRNFIVKVTPKIGPADVPLGAGGVYVPGPDATNCDLNRDGQIDFSLGSPEERCSAACTADKECTEWSNFASRGTFRLTLVDAAKQIGAIQADASTSAGFDPVAMKGKELRAFTGTLHYFSGGQQYTIEARCSDDIVLDLRDAPLANDRLCTSDESCDKAQGFFCAQLPSGEKACRTADGVPPRLPCVFPRTVLDNNPQ